MRRSILVLFAAIVVASGVIAAGITEAKADPTSYSQVVDNGSEDRFKADEGWGASSYGRGVYDDNYRFARPAEGAGLAQFKVKIPQTANYAVYARWPQVKGGNDAAPVGVVTSSGTEWTKVNQQRDGGRWVKVGVYEMQAGDDYSVMFSREASGEDYVIADAVKVEYDSAAPSKSEEDSSSSESSSPEGRAGQDVVKEARTWIGVRYQLGGQTRHGIDCSGLTMMVYKKFGVSLPHWDDKQYRMGVSVPKGKEQPGDLVFFNEHGRGISHVGIYSGNGKLIHASDYFNKVTESQMKYIKGYVGARRMLVNGRPVNQSLGRSSDEAPDDGGAAPEKEASPAPAKALPSSTSRGPSPSSGRVPQKAKTGQQVKVEKGASTQNQTQRTAQPQSDGPKEKTNPPNVAPTVPDEQEDQKSSPRQK